MFLTGVQKGTGLTTPLHKKKLKRNQMCLEISSSAVTGGEDKETEKPY